MGPGRTAVFVSAEKTTFHEQVHVANSPPYPSCLFTIARLVPRQLQKACLFACIPSYPVRASTRYMKPGMSVVLLTECSFRFGTYICRTACKVDVHGIHCVSSRSQVAELHQLIAFHH